MTTNEPLYAYVQRVWVARDHDERDDKKFIVEQIKALEAELDRLLAARQEYGATRLYERGEIW